MSNPRTYKYKFKNGIITVSRGVRTKFDWFLKIDLIEDNEGNKRLIGLDQNTFLTKKKSLEYANKLLAKYNLN